MCDRACTSGESGRCGTSGARKKRRGSRFPGGKGPVSWHAPFFQVGAKQGAFESGTLDLHVLFPTSNIFWTNQAQTSGKGQAASQLSTSNVSFTDVTCFLGVFQVAPHLCKPEQHIVPDGLWTIKLHGVTYRRRERGPGRSPRRSHGRRSQQHSRWGWKFFHRGTERGPG